ncbi:BREX-1 system adenine-specific DNA-methyltransferase PglX [Pantoea sp. GM01]|uniref:BREX-1 system adenine-specific DNA-methyltransferase PglX n=1 Tax=Pantoea sp. GM01 TaxID=1144320 RepID=UPI000271003E|nr:BREX-1 system adenine-specific DNA-methyltransferase PglX [Pantoea sp. GM01]EJL85975.1 N-6 DNA Methylase [Pantoea sp. GM01]
MNTSNIKKYAPVARKQFRDAVMQKLTTLGIEADKKGNLQISQATDLGDSVRYGQFTLEKSLTARRERLVKRAEKQDYDVLVEHIAYTWFNRFCAIRYMELHGYLDHGFRMLSHPTLEGGFEVLDHVPEVADALGLDKARLVEMKLAGDCDEELYRELLLAQCHTLQGAMPFLFEAVNDDIELALPDNLTRTDSILRGLVDTIPEEDWAHVEVIGWLYQFYISQKKADVIGEVVRSEDIPAATQLFTPNWIVQYLVQNSVGRQWLQTYPDSALRVKMPYYIEPAEQTPNAQAQLADTPPSSIEPESIKVLDPACGSGHILTETYNLLKAIYEERGYRTRDIPRLILENNIFGLDIDDRAAQLSGFAMLMLARQDDRRILGRGVHLNIVSLQESKLDIAELWTKLNFNQQVQRGSMGDMFAEGATLANADSAEYSLLMRTLALFTNAKTLGSLIQVPHEDEAALKAFLDGLYPLANEGDIQQKEAAAELIPYIQQAWILAQRYNAVIANPPYLDLGNMNPALKTWLELKSPMTKQNLDICFLNTALHLSKPCGRSALITQRSWMFLSRMEEFRIQKLKSDTLESMIYLGPRAFPEIDGEKVQTTAFVFCKNKPNDYLTTFFNLTDEMGEKKADDLLKAKGKYIKCVNDFISLPGFPLAFWASEKLISTFSYGEGLGEIVEIRVGLDTGNNDIFIRSWFEVSTQKIGVNFKTHNDFLKNKKKWVFHAKGGTYRKWYGNIVDVLSFDQDSYNRLLNQGNKLPSRNYYFKKGLFYSRVSSNELSIRELPVGMVFNSASPSIFSDNENDLNFTHALLNSSSVNAILECLSPTLNFQAGELRKIPIFKEIDNDFINQNTSQLVDISRNDWNAKEVSFNFIASPLVNNELSIKSAFLKYNEECELNTEMMRKLEEKNNHYFAQALGLSSNIVSNVPVEKISLSGNIHYLYKSTADKNDLFRSETLSEFISYALGVMMGRYSLDRDGLVYAHEGNIGFAELVAEGAYKTFPADEDGILPLMDTDWFDDDVTARVKEFVHTVWGEEHLQENLDFIAESLYLYAIKPKKGESSLDTIRRYLSTQFWKDHMKMYKKRPIYWLFSSGKEKAFECLVYLHRYNEGTLSRMRTEYVVPLLARYQGNIDLVNDQLKSAESGAATTRLKKELDGLTKKFNELRSFDDRLRHYADRRITIYLDDGVKVNYGKFGDLLADVKAITGSAPEEI